MLKITWLTLLVGAVITMTQIAGAEENIVYLGKVAPFSDSMIISKAIVNDCSLPAKQIEAIEEAAREDGTLKFVKDEEAVKAGKGRSLSVEIVNAVSGGNAFLGHHKQVVVKGRLYEDGAEIGSFSAIRHSMGGVFAGFKGSCKVLERCVEALGKDIVLWLKKPEMNSRIGE